MAGESCVKGRLLGKDLAKIFPLLFAAAALASAAGMSIAGFPYTVAVAYAAQGKVDPQLLGYVLNYPDAEAVIVLSSNSYNVKKELAAVLGNRLLRIYDNIPYALARLSVEDLAKIAPLDFISNIVPNLVFKKLQSGEMRILRLESLQAASQGVPALVSWGVFRTGSVAVWRELGITGSGSIVAILDTGVNPDHPLLRGKMFTMKPGDPSYPGGWIEFDSKGRAVCSSPHDTDGHGSWVTSIAVGGDTSTELIGHAPGARFVHALVLPTGSGTFAQVLAGLDWTADPYLCNGTKVSTIMGRPFRPDIVSMSFGAEGNYSSYLLPAIGTLLERGILVVAAIGNGGIYTSSYPGNIWGVMGIGSLERDDNISLFSSGELVEWPDPPRSWPFKGYYPKEYYKPDFVAPGVMIPGAYLSEDLLAVGTGTSATAPAVAGIMALAVQAARARGLNISQETMYSYLASTSQKPAEASQIRYGHGVVNAFKLVSKILGYDLRDVQGTPVPSSYLVRDRGRFLIPNYSGGFTLYLDDQKFQGSGGGASFTVPPSDYGDHYLHAFSLEAGVYSYARISVGPSLSLVPTSPGPQGPGHEVLLRLDGFPSVEIIIVRYLSRDAQVPGEIISLEITNLRGGSLLMIRIPYVSAAQSLGIVASDLTGLISASTSFYIQPSPQIVAVGPSPLQVLISAPQIVAVGSNVSVMTITYSGNARVPANFTIYVYMLGDTGPGLVASASATGTSASITFQASSEGVYVVWAQASSLSTAPSTGFSYLYIRAAPQSEIEILRDLGVKMSSLISGLAALNRSVERVSANISALAMMYIDLLGRYSDLFRRVEALSKDLNVSRSELNIAMATLTRALNSIRDLENLNRILQIVAAAFAMFSAALLAVLLRVYRSYVRRG